MTNLATAPASLAFGSVTSTVATVTILTNWTSAVVTGVLATASSELANLARYASNTLNGVGSVWESRGINQGYGEDRNPAITFDLGTVRPLEDTVVWNGSEQQASVTRMVIEVSNDGVGFSSLGEFTLTTQSPASETLPLEGVVCRYVRFTIRENGAGQTFPAGALASWTFVMIDEVQFHEYQGK